MKTCVENVDYTFVEVNGSPGFKLLEGPFEGVIYTYANIQVEDAPETSDSAVLRFDFTVIDPADKINEDFFDNEFKTVIGDVLYSVLQDSIGE